MAKKKITKQKQKQSQRVVVNIDNSRKTVRRNNPNPPQPRQPQIIPIPYPIMQQPPLQQQQQQFNRPAPQANNNQVFENNFNRLNERINNLAENFNNHAQNIIGRLNAQPPANPQTPQTPESPPEVQLPRTQERRTEKVIVLNDDEITPPVIRQPNQAPIIQGTRDLITSAKKVKIFSPQNDGIPYEINLQQPPSRALFLSPSVNMNANEFNKPKTIHSTGKEFNQPVLQLEFKPEPPKIPNEQFNQQLEETDKKDIVEAEEPKKKSKYNIGQHNREQAIQRRKDNPEIEKIETLDSKLKEKDTELKDIINQLNQKGEEDKGLIQKRLKTSFEIAELEIEKYYKDKNLNILQDYNNLIEELKALPNENIKDDSIRKRVNRFIKLNIEEYGKVKNKGNSVLPNGLSSMRPDTAINAIEKSRAVVNRIAKKQNAPSQGISRQFGANIKTLNDLDINQSMSSKGGKAIPI